MKAWGRHLEGTLQFPFKAIVDEYQTKGSLKQGDRLKVFKIELVDDHYGVIVSCRKGGNRYDFPIADLAVVDKKSTNVQHIQDYRVWFANR